MSDFVRSFDHYTEGMSLSPGHACECCAECRAEGCIDTDQSDERHNEAFDEGGFSWSQCDTCGSTLGGDRYPAHLIDHKSDKSYKPIYHVEVCTDCLMFSANGDEPEQWQQHP